MKRSTLVMALAIALTTASAHAQTGGSVSATLSDLAVSIQDAAGGVRSVAGASPAWYASHALYRGQLFFGEQSEGLDEVLPTASGAVMPTVGSSSRYQDLTSVDMTRSGLTVRVSNEGLGWSGIHSDNPYLSNRDVVTATQVDGSVVTVQRDVWKQSSYMSRGWLTSAAGFTQEGTQGGAGLPVTLQPGEELSVTSRLAVDAFMSTADIQDQMTLLRNQVGDRPDRVFLWDAVMKVEYGLFGSLDLPDVKVTGSSLCDGTNPSIHCDVGYSGAVIMGMKLKDDGNWSGAFDDGQPIPQHNVFGAPVRFTFFNGTEEAKDFDVGGNLSVLMTAQVYYVDTWTTETVLSVTPPASVPEPSTWALVAMGLGGLVLRRRLRDSHAAE
jgi:PEP-CTERM motif